MADLGSLSECCFLQQVENWQRLSVSQFVVVVVVVGPYL